MINSFMVLKYFFSILIFFAASCKKHSSVSSAPPPPPSDSTFTNPLLSSGPDPWVVEKDSTYYYTNTLGNRVAIYTTTKMSELDKASAVTIWSPPSATLYSKEIWAPEIHFIQGKWYAYFAADDGNNNNHRIYALENDAQNPTSDSWSFKGKIADTATDKWAIDPSIFEYNGQLYLLWSGWPGDVNIEQDIFIAKMKDPLTMDGGRVMISSPVNSWEKSGAPPTVNEGPEALINNNGKLFIVYSSSGCWTDDYNLGLLTLKDGGNPLNPADWIKSSAPVFSTNADHGAFGPGHCSFFKSKDGKQDWILYHANPGAGLGCGNSRNPRMQPFTWHTDGSPDFGTPVNINSQLIKPSGE